MHQKTKKEVIEQFIIEQIDSGELKENQKLLTEKELCLKFSVSRMTVNNAMNNLVDQGYIVRIPGKGSFVKKRPLLRYINHKRSFTEDMKSIGKTAGSITLEFHVAPAYHHLKALTELHVDKDENIYHFIRLRTGDGEPIAVQSTYIPASIVPDFDYSALDKSLDEYIASRGIELGAFETKLRAVIADQETANLLKIKKGDPLLESRTYRRTRNGTLYEYTETYYRADQYEYTFSSAVDPSQMP